MAPRKVELFVAGCPLCDDATKLTKKLACPSCDIEVVSLMGAAGAERARGYGIKQVPAVVIDGKLADCCCAPGPNAESLKQAGLGVPE